MAYGLEGILGNLVTSVATPAIGGMVGDIASKEIEDQLLKEITQTTVGALSGAAVGAGLGALTGGKSGALSGALTGGVGGGVGGYNAPQISQMFGFNADAQGLQPTAMNRQINPATLQGQQVPGSVIPEYKPLPMGQELTKDIPGIGSPSSIQAPLQKAVSPQSVGLSATQAPQPIQNVTQPIPQTLPTATTQQPSGFKGYMDFLKKNYEPLAGGFFLGSAYGANQDTQEQAQQRQHEQLLADLIDQQKATKFGRSIWGKAAGGPVEVGLADPQISVHFPAWAQEKIQREGGLAALQAGMKQGFANGGYANVHPFEPQDFHPQSQIHSAQPYPAAAPTSVIDTVAEGASFGRGGLIDGPGDGMSDSIHATIDRREPVKVADGEYVIPKEIAHKYGPEKLKRMMSKVRASAHAKKGQQIVQGAAQREFIKALTGVKA